VISQRTAGPHWATSQPTVTDNTGHQRAANAQLSSSRRPASQVVEPPRFSLARRKPRVQIPSPPPHNPASQSVASTASAALTSFLGRAGAAKHRGAARSPRPARPARRPHSARQAGHGAPCRPPGTGGRSDPGVKLTEVGPARVATSLGPAPAAIHSATAVWPYPGPAMDGGLPGTFRCFPHSRHSRYQPPSGLRSRCQRCLPMRHSQGLAIVASLW
jgi:hypothetical protein